MLDSWYHVRRFESLTCPYPITPLVIRIKLFSLKYLARSCPDHSCIVVGTTFSSISQAKLTRKPIKSHLELTELLGDACLQGDTSVYVTLSCQYADSMKLIYSLITLFKCVHRGFQLYSTITLCKYD